MSMENLSLHPINSSAFSKLIMLHDRKGEEFMDEMSKSINNWDDTWREMLYCILAGTQVSTDIVRKSYFNLIESIPEVLDYKIIKNSPLECQKKIALTLKKNGYRFPETKAKTMISAANYFENIIQECKNFRDLDWYNIRDRLIKNVRGIGNKIASHWLRNIGFDVPIVDIHVRRVLSCGGLIDDKYANYQISDSEYRYIEKNMIDISNKININVAKMDFILWNHGREYCVHKACLKCPFGNKNA